MRTRRLVSGLAFLLATSFATERAGAQSVQDQLLAQSLFDEARALMDRGEYAAACPKLEESQRLDPGGGTLLNLAICHEKEGRLGTALVDFQTARREAQKDGREDRLKIADDHLATLAKRVPRLAIAVAQEAPGLVVLVDGAPLPRATYGVAAMVDPGVHVVDARASGLLPFRIEVRLAEGESRRVQVPPLMAEAPERAGAPLAQPPAEPTSRTNPLHTAAVITATTGMVVATVAAIGWGVFSLKRRSECIEERSFCTQDGLDALESERAFGWTATVSASIGVLGLVSIAILPRTISVHASPRARGASTDLVVRF